MTCSNTPRSDQLVARLQRVLYAQVRAMDRRRIRQIDARRLKRQPKGLHMLRTLRGRLANELSRR